MQVVTPLQHSCTALGLCVLRMTIIPLVTRLWETDMKLVRVAIFAQTKELNQKCVEVLNYPSLQFYVPVLTNDAVSFKKLCSKFSFANILWILLGFGFFLAFIVIYKVFASHFYFGQGQRRRQLTARMSDNTMSLSPWTTHPWVHSPLWPLTPGTE